MARNGGKLRVVQRLCNMRTSRQERFASLHSLHAPSPLEPLGTHVRTATAAAPEYIHTTGARWSLWPHTPKNVFLVGMAPTRFTATIKKRIQGLRVTCPARALTTTAGASPSSPPSPTKNISIPYTHIPRTSSKRLTGKAHGKSYLRPRGQNVTIAIAHLHLSVELALLLIDDLTEDAVVRGEPPAIEGPEAAVVSGVVADFGPTASGSAPACSSSLITCCRSAMIMNRERQLSKQAKLPGFEECARRGEKRWGEKKTGNINEDMGVCRSKVCPQGSGRSRTNP